MDFETFFDIYMQPRGGNLLHRDGIEFRYAAASLMIACSRSDFHEDPEETRLIKQILTTSFKLSENTLDRLIEFAQQASEATYLEQITKLVNRQFSDRDKRFLLEKLWAVAYADGRIEDLETAFIEQIAEGINMSATDVATARTLARQEFA